MEISRSKRLIIVITVAVSVFLFGYLYLSPVKSPTRNGDASPAPVPAETPSSFKKIKVNLPLPNSLVKSPLEITGEAVGAWYFEATFPIKLLDKGGNVIATAQAEARPPAGGDWTTGKFVPFKATLVFSAQSGQSGALVFQNDNPSGLPEKAEAIRIPITFK